jgi:hypothetical protein
LSGLTPSTSSNGAVTLAGTLGVPSGGTGLTSFTANQIHYGSFSQSSNLTFDGTTLTASNINSSGQLTLTNASNWNVYASGAGANYFNGALNVGTTSLSTQTQITFSGNAPQSSGTAYFIVTNPTFTSSTTSAGQLFRSGLVTQAASFTMAQYNAYLCSASSIGSGSSVTNSYGFQVSAAFAQTGMTNVYAFNGGLSSGTGIWNLYNNGTAANYMAGQLVVGSTTLTNGFVDFSPTQSTNTYQFRVAGTNTNTNSAIFGTVLGGTLTGTSSTTSAYVTQIGGSFNVASGATIGNYYGIDNQPSWNGTATPTNITLNRAFLNLGALSTGATSNLYNYASNNIIANASSTATITNAYGFIHSGFSTSNSVTIGTAYAFYGNQSTSGATSAWNLYMAGNAPNYMAGSLTVVGGIAGGSF